MVAMVLGGFGAGGMHDPTDITQIGLEVFLHTLGIVLFVFLTMVVVDYLNVLTQGRLTSILKGSRGRQYLLSSFLGSLPGCLGAFLVVSMYLRGMLGFGALAGSLVASSGDAAFVLLAEIPKTALFLFGILLVLGIVLGWASDQVAARLKILPCAECRAESHHLSEPECRCWPEEGVLTQLARPHPARVVYLVILLLATVAVVFGVLGPESFNWMRVAILLLVAAGGLVVLTVPDHYLVEHIGHHIVRRHLPGIFAWTFGALLVLAVADHLVDLRGILSGHLVWALVMAALVGIIPDSGPQLLFVFLFADGTVPFSVLLTNAVVQDGHGLLPLLSVSVRDSILVKLFNLVSGLGLGLLVYALGY